MKLHIKHMTGLESKAVLQNELKNLGLQYIMIGIGGVEIMGDVNEKQIVTLKKNLHRYGLELSNDRKNILIERIKDLVTQMVNNSEEQPKKNYSDYISEKLQYDYTYLSNIFSERKGITIQHFIINNKIERVKELLLSNDMSLTEISYVLHYSSVAHLSNQFKKVTGLTPSFYKQMNQRSFDHEEPEKKEFQAAML